MVARQIPVVVGGAVAFIAAVAAGAFVIVSLSTDEGGPVAATQQGLLMEGASAIKPFAAVTPAAPPMAGRARTNAPSALPEREAPRFAPPPPAGSEPEATAEAKPEAEAPRDRAEAPIGRPANELGKSGPMQAHRLEVKPPPVRPAVPLTPATLPAQPAPPIAQPRADGLLTPIEIRRMRLSLRLTREQEPYWPPVEQALMEISAQQATMVRAGQDPKDAFGIGAGMRVYSAARPLLEQLREDQKAQVRARARAMGFGSIASSL